MRAVVLVAAISAVTSGQNFLTIAPFGISAASNGVNQQNGLLRLLRGDGSDLLGIFNHRQPTIQRNFESINDYDDQIVHSKKSLVGHRSKGARHWTPFTLPPRSSHASLNRRSNRYNRNNQEEVAGDDGVVTAPRVNNPAKSTPPDYEVDLDQNTFPPKEEKHSTALTYSAPHIKAKPLQLTETFSREMSNFESEISSFSSVHQSSEGSYRNVQKIMDAFSNLLADPNKPRKIAMSDDTEMGMNRYLSSHLFESDIVLTVPQMKGIVMAEKENMEGRRRHKRKVITGAVYRWTDPHSIPYRFKGSDPGWKARIVAGMRIWESQTCLRFHENYGVEDHIVFYKGSGCFSSIGKTGGSQMISIGHGCDNVGIIAHEIAHSLGFWHEQSRPDRDYYIKIRRQFVASGSESNFLKSSYHEADSMGLPYDLGSIMHYGPEAFSSRKGEVTIETINGRYESTIGQRIVPSFVDIKQMNRLYCNDACRGMQLACRHGGYPDPNNCQSCKCPDGLSGPICNDVQGECGSELVAARGWQEIQHNGKGDCVWRLRTTNGKIRLQLSRVNFECKRTCESYVEIKSSVDWQRTGFRTCCNEDWSVVSEGEAVLVIVKSESSRQNSMRIQYVRVNSLTEMIDESEMLADSIAPAIRKWVPGQENRAFRGVEYGPVEKFILNSMGAASETSAPTVSSRILLPKIVPLFIPQ